MKTSEFLKLRDEVCDRLVAEGWDFDDARFATMSAGRVDGEGNKQTPTHPLLVKLAEAKDAIDNDDRPKSNAKPSTKIDFDDWMDYIDGKVSLSEIVSAHPHGDEYSDQIDS